MTWVSRLIAGAAVVAVLGTTASAPAAAGATTSDGRSAGRLSFGPCTDAALVAAGAECGVLRVPLRHTRPDGDVVDLVVSRIRAADPTRRRGILLVNPGGPGGPGLDFAARLRPELGAAADQYDLIGFDPRFVGGSAPITCGPMTLRDVGRSAGTDRSGFLESARLSADFARRCRERNADLLPYAGIRDVARDMDRIRAALGESRMSYYGVSWGADLGAVYSELFPHRVDRMVLDSVSAVESEYALNQAGAGRAEAALAEWARWAAARHDSYRLGSTPAQVQATVRGLVDALARRPVEVDGHLVDDNILPFLIRRWLGNEADDPVLARTLGDLVAAVVGRTVSWSAELTEMLTLLDLRDPMIENILASSFGVFCADPRWPDGAAPYWRNVQHSRSSQPIFGPLGNNVTPCAFWPTPAEAPVRVAHDVPVLMVQATRDNSPYHLAVDLHQRLTASRLVTVDIRAHGMYARRVNGDESLPCVDQTVNAYLATGTMPPAGTWC
ncbi:alpha/beta hydrolase [Plantactinospora veratri]|uniref:Alpha/beta hydrolase n=1 Tax=Plantactinospora veratri TaxID=1436122 RepID=A0ABU7S6T5_9ACTN